ncbi:MAG: TIGR02099 family protein [Gammaproteobacteria bacterium]|nr:TIGR02099 family protein [Gammaproteobacteria bacterium]
MIGWRHAFLLSTSRTRRMLRWSRRLLLSLLLPLLLLAAFGQWWLLPRLNDYREALASALGDALQMPVHIETVTATLEGWRLALGLRGVSVDDPDRNTPLAYCKQVAITLNLWRSLQEWRPVVRRIRLEGASLTLEPGSGGMPRLFAGLRAAPEPGEGAVHPLLNLRQLDIVGEELVMRRSDGSTWQLRHPYLHLQNTARGRRLALSADLPMNPSGRLELTVEPLPMAAANAKTAWRLQGQIHVDDPAGQAQKPTAFEFTPTDAGWQAVIRDLRAENLLAWATPWLDETARQWLTPLDPHGELPETTIRIDPMTETYQATVALRDVEVRSTHRLPGFSNLTGQLTLTPEQGQLELACRKVQVDTAGLLRAPITLDTLDGAVHWQRSNAGLQVESTGLELANPDLQGRFWGRVTLPAAGKPVLDIRGHYHDVKVQQAWRYLPVAVIPPPGVTWLDRALVDGRVATGELIFQGPPSAFPFDRGEGLFETRFQVEDAVLDYAPGWPRLERLWAEVQFRNRGLTVTAERGRLLDGQLEGATTHIDDLGRVTVQVQGRVKGPGASMWQALKDSPLGRELNKDLPDLRISGAATLDLELALPTDGRPGQARGRVGLLDNEVALPAWKVALDRLRGEVRFTEADLEAQGVQALWRGEPIQIELELANRAGRRELRTQVVGRLGLAALVGQPAAAALKSQITGASDWSAVLIVPISRRERRGGVSAFSLELRSDLRGVTFDLPAPLGKTAREVRPLRIAVQSDERKRWIVSLEYEPEVRAILALDGLLDTPRFERGELRLGAGAARLPDEPGLVVVADLPRWSWAAPAKAPASAGESASPGCQSSDQASSFNPLTVVRSLEAHIAELVIAGQSFTGMTVHARRYPEGLRVELDGATLSGRLTMPDEPTPEQPVNAALRRLQVQRIAGRVAAKVSERSALDPCRLPPLVLTVAELRMDDQDLGRLRLIAMPRPDGIRLTGVELHAEQQRIDASGEWRWGGGHQISQLHATLHSSALGETLAVFGYPGSGIARGVTEAELDAQWAAALPDFALERMSGTLKLHIGPGQLLEISPGLGRMIGLFSVQNLNRRLSLDFSDLFQPGTSFDQISGVWVFADGQARTDDLNIEAPAARVEIRGRIGLKDRDYDQRITVTPHLGGTLPIAGAIVGGPAAGAAVFVAERLLKKGIEQATRYQYRLQGSWDDPLLEPSTVEEETSEIPEPLPPTRWQGFNSDN